MKEVLSMKECFMLQRLLPVRGRGSGIRTCFLDMAGQLHV